jgi:prevent-host-death family protein
MRADKSAVIDAPLQCGCSAAHAEAEMDGFFANPQLIHLGNMARFHSVMQVTIHEAKTQLSKLIAAAERGEVVIIARRDKPVVRIVANEAPKIDRSGAFGCMKGRFPGKVIDDLTNNPELDDEIAREFEMSAKRPF